MMIIHRKCWITIGILCMLCLAGCGTGSGSQQTTTSLTPTFTTTATQISVPGHPTMSPTPGPTTRSTKPATPTSTRTGSGGGPTSQEQQLAQYVFGLINHDRVMMGLSAYIWSAAIAKGARLHNVRMVAYGQLSHQCPGEVDLGVRVTNDGLVWRAAGENIGWSNYPDPQQGLLANHQGMMAEKPPDDGHRRNILSTSYTLVGIDVLIDAQHGIWLTEDFAQL